MFLLESKVEKLTTSTGVEYDWKPYQELGKQKKLEIFDKGLEELVPLETELLKYPTKSMNNSTELYSINALYTEIKKNYPVYTRQFDIQLAKSPVFKSDKTMEPYEAFVATKYLSSLDENNLAVDHRLSQIWNLLP